MEWLIPLIIVVVLVLVIGIYLWATYNSLVTLNVRVDEAWSDITVQLKRRADLIHGGASGLHWRKPLTQAPLDVLDHDDRIVDDDTDG